MVISDSTPSPNVRSTAGIDCPRMKLMLRQSMVSRTVYRKEDNVRRTSSWTSCPQVQWLHELGSVIDYSQVFDSSAGGAAAPGKHPVSTAAANSMSSTTVASVSNNELVLIL